MAGRMDAEYSLSKSEDLRERLQLPERISGRTHKSDLTIRTGFNASTSPPARFMSSNSRGSLKLVDWSRSPFRAAQQPHVCRRNEFHD